MFFALLLPLAAGAQTVYQSDGKGGRVYSDTPLPGSRPRTLAPENTVPPPPALPPARPAAAPKAAETSFAYRSFAIVFPEDDGAIGANTAAVDVRLAIDPPLQLGMGHAYAVRLNGQAVPGRYTADEFTLPPEVFGDPLIPNQRYRLEASVVDAAGKTWIAAAPVEFRMRPVVLRRLEGVNRSPDCRDSGRPSPVGRRCPGSGPGH